MRAKRVLIAEDNLDGAESLRLVVETWGHRAEAVSDGLAAVRFALDFRPEVAILDINMPLLDGYATARLLRGAHPGVVVVAMTGAEPVETRQRARQAGFHHYFVKPVDLAALKALLDSEAPLPIEPGALPQA